MYYIFNNGLIYRILRFLEKIVRNGEEVGLRVNIIGKVGEKTQVKVKLRLYECKQAEKLKYLGIPRNI